MEKIYTLLAGAFLTVITCVAAAAPTTVEAQTAPTTTSECVSVVVDLYCQKAHDGLFIGDREVETVQITVCALPEHWAAIQRQDPNDSWWGEALADTGRPDLRWLKIRAIKEQCRIRHAPIGARVGTRYLCPPTVEGWYWTEVVTGPGTYFMSIPVSDTTPNPANPDPDENVPALIG